MTSIEEASTGEISIRALGITELAALFDANELAQQAFKFVKLQPRARHARLGRMLDQQEDRCVGAMRAAAEEIARRKPADAAERDVRAEVLTRWGLVIGDWDEIRQAVESISLSEADELRPLEDAVDS